MHSCELAGLYQVKTDDELLLLARDSEQLTAEAKSYLLGELTRRRLEVPKAAEESEPPRGDEARPVIGCHLQADQFLVRVMRIYREHFWTFTLLVTPAVLIGYFAVLIGQTESRAIARTLPHGAAALTKLGTLTEALLAKQAGFLLSWIVFCLSYAVVSATVDEISAGFVLSVPQVFAEARRHTRALFCASMLLYAILWAGAIAAGLVFTAIVFLCFRYGFVLTGFVPQIVIILLLGAAVLCCSRFGLAIPGVVLDDLQATKAISRSNQLTKGHWTILAALLTKSVIGGYIAGKAPFWIAPWLPREVWSFPLASQLLTVASFCGVIAVEPLMFIGFALLYLETSAKQVNRELVGVTNLA